MALKQAWIDRDNFIKLFKNLHNYLKYFKNNFDEPEVFKQVVLDDAERKLEIKKLIDEDPDWDMTTIQYQYLEFKAIYDYLTGV